VGIVAVLLIALVAFLCWRRRRQNANKTALSSPPGGRSPFMDQSPSPPGGSPFAALASGAGVGAATPRSRHQRGPSSNDSGFSDNLVPIFDQRVDPNQMYMHWDHAGSRASLQDNEDYSRRVLRVANPS